MTEHELSWKSTIFGSSQKINREPNTSEKIQAYQTKVRSERKQRIDDQVNLFVNHVIDSCFKCATTELEGQSMTFNLSNIYSYITSKGDDQHVLLKAFLCGKETPPPTSGELEYILKASKEILESEEHGFTVEDFTNTYSRNCSICVEWSSPVVRESTM